ncbi:glycosyltransferase family 2 protein [Shewanella sp. 202IG2-18]|uniref:glycosyltransferase family 2 protein n=1 Tax=Parashewanella hymeniacidonis TaxID=2807618 RepID=UPI0019620AE3|nr:glycosyltransferase family 2 protein [Parashewanella hymeniacidonis]MBM7072103.1 glycosyltransferase family 2 protein [Parashewanella hymeniacidonis]
MITLSVIIPTIAKDIRLLERAIDSIITNRNIDIEIVIVNDNRKACSLLENLSQKYSSYNIHVYQNEGVKGAGGARNFGVQQASGDLITFLDDDDFILPGRLERMIECFNKQHADNIILVSTGRVYEYNDFERVEVVKKQMFGTLRLTDIYIHNQIDIGFMVKRSTFLAINGFDTTFKNLEDWDFIIRCLELGNAYKIKTHSYIVKNDINTHRVSNNDYIGLSQLANKHRGKFGEKWFYKIKTQELRSSANLNLIETANLFFKLRSFYPVKHYISTLLRRSS